MRFKKNQKRVLDRLKDCMREDVAKCMILGMSEFGLVEMTRQRSRGSLIHTIFTGCPYCTGSGLIKSLESTAIEIERGLKKVIQCHQQFALRLVVHPEMFDYLRVSDKEFLEKIADKLNARLFVEIDDTLHLNDYHFYSTINHQRIEI
jgi:ribonuclease G